MWKLQQFPDMFSKWNPVALFRAMRSRATLRTDKELADIVLNNLNKFDLYCKDIKVERDSKLNLSTAGIVSLAEEFVYIKINKLIKEEKDIIYVLAHETAHAIDYLRDPLHEKWGAHGTQEMQHDREFFRIMAKLGYPRATMCHEFF